ncbi:hypothetical protein A1O3_00356 [Capronia epimyces CBS 606.96]|uniref:Uncharacterized protein n=1 Tax=Capronia epimyces CBS 606.96 TaxID=1182542 RepID=W9YRB2_9EURO|nr:uncharacterized protein A1O3_00356 [Capronia epimyces CBS 606.96]EXJ91806.1 hypothetical protein A1O3_00356 [Capronia epimyces CBS 606.96]
MPLPRQDTTSSTESASSASSVGRARQIIDDRYIDPDGLRNYMDRNFERGSWTIRVKPLLRSHSLLLPFFQIRTPVSIKLGKVIITAPRTIPKVSHAFLLLLLFAEALNE